MSSMRAALLSRPKLVITLAVLSLVVAFSAPLHAAGGNFVSVYLTGANECWYDVAPCGTTWTNRGNGCGGNRDDEAAAGPSISYFGTFVGVKPQNVVEKQGMRVCSI